MLPGITYEIKLRKTKYVCRAYLFAQTFDAALVVIVISLGDAIFAKLCKTLPKQVNKHISTDVDVGSSCCLE